MSKLRRDRTQALEPLPSRATYEVGYGKPPRESRFKPGQSGNPGGRPKGSKNRSKRPALNEERLKDIILEEAYRTVSVNDAKGPISLPMAQAVVRSLAVNAAKGNARAQRLFTQILGATERDNKRLHDEWLETAIQYKTSWEFELERRNRFGIDAPAPLPHPDDIVIDLRTATVQVKGPMTAEEKVTWDLMLRWKAACDHAIAELEGMLDDPECEYREMILEDLKREKKRRALIAKVIPD
jgi:hypothetical protein